MKEYVIDGIENIVEKGENAGYSVEHGLTNKVRNKDTNEQMHGEI